MFQWTSRKLLKDLNQSSVNDIWRQAWLVHLGLEAGDSTDRDRLFELVDRLADVVEANLQLDSVEKIIT